MPNAMTPRQGGTPASVDIRFGGRNVRINYYCDRAQRLIDYLFADVMNAHAADTGAAVDETVELSGTDEALSYVNQSGQTLRSTPGLGDDDGSDGDLANHLLGDVIYYIADRCNTGLLFHAGAVACGADVIILPGESGAGKTSTTAFLTYSGCRYLTDELVYVPLQTATPVNDEALIWGFTRPFNFKTAVLPVIKAQLGVDSHDYPRYTCRDASLVPHRRFNSRCGEPHGVVRTVVFPHFDALSAGELIPLSQAQVALGLMGCLINARNLDGHGFHAVSALARGLRGFNLRFAHFDQVAALLTPASPDASPPIHGMTGFTPR